MERRKYPEGIASFSPRQHDYGCFSVGPTDLDSRLTLASRRNITARGRFRVDSGIGANAVADEATRRNVIGGKIRLVTCGHCSSNRPCSPLLTRISDLHRHWPSGIGHAAIMSEVNHILDAIQEGNAKAADELLPLVYEELRKLAAHKMANEAPGHTLQATALVHEAWLRLAGQPEEQRWENRAHFFAAAAEAMRRIL